MLPQLLFSFWQLRVKRNRGPDGRRQRQYDVPCVQLPSTCQMHGEAGTCALIAAAASFPSLSACSLPCPTAATVAASTTATAAATTAATITAAAAATAAIAAAALTAPAYHSAFTSAAAAAMDTWTQAVRILRFSPPKPRHRLDPPDHRPEHNLPSQRLHLLC